MNKTRLTLIGYGKVASHLADAFLRTNNVTLVQVYNRKLGRVQHLSNQCDITDNIDQLKPADVFIISVSDRAIADVSSKIKQPNALVVHTSGTFPLDGLNSKGRKGVLYPLQSFSVDKPVDFSTLPFCLEAGQVDDLSLLTLLVHAIGAKPFYIDTSQRQALHVAAVFANNFTNHLYQMAESICEENNVPFEILHPLILETAQKIQTISPAAAQTGPASRKDTQTIKRQLSLLNSDEKDVYEMLTNAIKAKIGG